MTSITKTIAENVLNKSKNLKKEQYFQNWQKVPELFNLKEFGSNYDTGKFGEEIVKNYYNSIGKTVEVIHNNYDLLIDGVKKLEIKTAFMGLNETFWVNQIYEDKTWDHLAFVLVSYNKIEVWECARPAALGNYFKINNGWSWNGKINKLNKLIWTKIWEESY